MFELNSTLKRDSVPLVETEDLIIRLINDARYPWMLIVPKVESATELHDLDGELYSRVMAVARDCGEILKQAFNADKINTAAIGNMVPQLHIHVVARHKGDAAWPGPIWGIGEMEPLSESDCAERIGLIKEHLAGLA